LVLDARLPFSDTKGAARELAPGAHVVAESEWKTLGMLLWRPDIQLRSSAAWSGQPFRYIRPDKQWHKRGSLASLITEECRAAPNRVYFAGDKSGLGAQAKCARDTRWKNHFGDYPTTWEWFDLYRMDCACVSKPH
jgi:hypothetical protein